MSGIDILINVICVAVVIVSLLLICLVLVQPSKSGGMGAAFGGIGQSVFGAQMGSHLTKLTVVLTSVFFVLALGLAFLIGHRADVNERQREAEVLSGISASMQPRQPSAATDGGSAPSAAPDAEKASSKQ
ncbi:MAG: preprotein translocase subunit SecG [Victivallaceae bacterium]|nr:preprotein translocase subunit SecG [Victivallaceae bacterium]